MYYNTNMFCLIIITTTQDRRDKPPISFFFLITEKQRRCVYPHCAYRGTNFKRNQQPRVEFCHYFLGFQWNKYKKFIHHENHWIINLSWLYFFILKIENLRDGVVKLKIREDTTLKILWRLADRQWIKKKKKNSEKGRGERPSSLGAPVSTSSMSTYIIPQAPAN